MTAPASFAIFETSLGECAIVWGQAGLKGVFLPERGRKTQEERVRNRHPGVAVGEAPEAVRRAIDGICALLRGEAVTFPDTELDLTGIAEFNMAVYEVTRRIPPGQTLTYGEIARQVGAVSDARAVGQALGRNPWPIVVPCHRVLAASGRTGGFSAPGGIETKLRLLSIEARHAPGPPGLFADLPLVARPRRTA